MDKLRLVITIVFSLILLVGCSPKEEVLNHQEGQPAQTGSTSQATDFAEEYVMDKTPSKFNVDEVKSITVGLIDADVTVQKQAISSVDDAIAYGQLIFDEYNKAEGWSNDNWVMMGIERDEANDAWLTWFSEPPLHPGECISVAFYGNGEIIAVFAGE